MSTEETTKKIKKIENLTKENKKEKKKSNSLKKKKDETKKIKEEKKKKSKTLSSDNNTNKSENHRVFNFILKFILFCTFCSSLFLIYELYLLNSIETQIRYIVISIILVIDLIFSIITFNKKKKKKIGILIFMILFSIIYFLLGGCISYIYSQIDNINKNTVTYSSSFVTMYNKNISNIKDAKNYKIGILDNEESPDGYIIPQEIIKENNLNDYNEIIKYSDYPSMVSDLYADIIDAVFITSSFPSLFEDLGGYESIKTDTKVIMHKEKEMKKSDFSNKEVASIHKSVMDPFTVLLMGIDSTSDVLSKNAIANGDSLILVTFNPKTLNATMLSIPRDSYLPIACWPNKDENKITHAAAYGNDCMMNTIEDYFGINIDYYAKINFKGLVKLVNAVGGIEINVPKKLCTDDSNRGGTICIEAGKRTLNGEQALVFARNRKELSNGDFGRGLHQQEIIMALINKMKTITETRKFKEILNTISNSLDTNFTTKQMLEFYNIGKDIIKNSIAIDNTNLINIQQLYLYGSSQMIYDERMRRVLYNYVPNTYSKNDIIKVMKQNLELETHNEIYKFDFSINSLYSKQIIGKGPYSAYGLYNLLPDFVGLTKEEAENLANKIGLDFEFKGIDGKVVEQNYPFKKRIDKIHDKVIFTLSILKNEDEDDDDKNSEDNNDDDKNQNDDNDSNTSPSPEETIEPTPEETVKPSPSETSTPIETSTPSPNQN